MLIPLECLQPHPSNANVMPEPLLGKLVEHIRATDRYPALIVRPLRRGSDDAGDAQQWQILDGHHRAVALRRLGRTHARCDAWDVDDQQAAMLLLTLNRLRGEDDPHRRGALMAQMAREARVSIDRMAALLPDDRARIERLVALAGPPAPPPPLPRDEALPQPPRALTLFLDAQAYRAVVKRLESLHPQRARALCMALGISMDEASTNSADHFREEGSSQ